MGGTVSSSGGTKSASKEDIQAVRAYQEERRIASERVEKLLQFDSSPRISVRDGVIRLDRQGLSKIDEDVWSSMFDLFSENSAITSFDLSFNHLSFKDEVFNLDMVSNPRSILEFLCGGCDRLERWHLNNNHILGFHLSADDDDDGTTQKDVIPAKEFALQFLDLSFNELREFDISASFRFPKLMSLDLKHNPLTSPPSCISSVFPNLQTLSLGLNALVDVSSLSMLRSLRVLDLTQNPHISHKSVSTILESLNELESLSLCRCALRECPRVFPSSLRVLNISFNLFPEFPKSIFQHSDSKLKSFKANFIFQDSFRKDIKNKVVPSRDDMAKIAKNLEVFHWNGNCGESNNELSLDFLSECLQLKDLALANNELVEVLCDSNTVLSSLSIFSLSSNSLNEYSFKGVKHMNDSLPVLKELHVGYNRFVRIPMSLIGICKREVCPLQVLWCQGNPLVDADIFSAAWNGRKALASLLREDEEEKSCKRYGDAISVTSVEDIVKGVIWGAALGDSLGIRTEFMSGEKSATLYPFSSLSLDQFVEGYTTDDFHQQGWWKDHSDDTDQLILIGDVLMEMCGGDDGDDGKECGDESVSPSSFNVCSLAEKFLCWAHRGFFQLGDIAGAGIGSTTANTLRDPRFLDSPSVVAQEVWESSGRHVAPNGAVMRTAIIGCFNGGNISEDELEKIVVDAASVTHADPRCYASCIAVVDIIAKILLLASANSGDDSIRYIDVDSMLQHGIDRGRLYLSEKLPPRGQRPTGFRFTSAVSNDWEEPDLEEEQAFYLKEYDRHASVSDFSKLKLDEQKAVGYTFKTMGAALHAFKTGTDFSNILLDMVMYGGDADTNGAVVGALMGAKIGYRNLPQEWISQQTHAEWLNEWIEKFIETCVRK